MLEASDSPIFIDRDPAMFALIQKCLRCGCDETVANEAAITCPLPLNEDYLKVSRRELFLEVEFFRLTRSRPCCLVTTSRQLPRRAEGRC